MRAPLPLIFDAAVAWFFCFCCAVIDAGGIVVASAMDEAAADHPMATHERVVFLNFSDEPIPLFWIAPNDHERNHVGDVHPYQPYVSATFSGHEFAYDWKGTGGVFHVTVERTDEREDAAEEIEAQVYVMGSQGKDPPLLKRVVCATTKGEIRADIRPLWSPLGAARFLDLIGRDLRYFNGCALNRVVPEFLTQLGIGADYDQRTRFRSDVILDDPPQPEIKFKPGFLSYAGSGEHSRSSEIFIVMPDTPQSQLDYFGENSWETPFGYVLPEDLPVVGSFHSYGDMAPWGNGPDPQRIYEQDGYEYLAEEFPEMDYIKGCAIVPDELANDAEFLQTAGYDDVARHAFGEDHVEEL